MWAIHSSFFVAWGRADGAPAGVQARVVQWGMAKDASGDRFEIVHLEGESRYELRDGDATAGVATYRRSDGVTTFTHTIVDPEYGGQGLGGRIARHMLDEAVQRGDRIVPVCTFIQAYVKKHPEYEQHVDWPEAGA